MADDFSEFCLVTGATGVIGSPVVRHLLDAGHKVLATGQRPCPFMDHEHLAYVSLDLHDQDAVHGFFDTHKPRYLIHLAWEATPGKFWHSRENFRWVSSSAFLLDSFVSAGGKKAVLAGSCAEYDWTDTVLDEQTSALSPNTFYSSSKNAFRQMAEVIAKDIDLVWARIFFPYGPDEDPKKLISYIVEEVTHGRVPEFQNPGRAVDFIHLEDVAESLARLAFSTHIGAVNICSGNAYRPSEIALACARVFKKEPVLRAALEKIVQKTPQESLVLGNAKKIDHLLSDWPVYSLEDGLRTYIGQNSGSRPVRK